MGELANMEIVDILKLATQQKASDAFIIAGQPVSLKVDGRISPLNDTKLLPEDTFKLIEAVFKLHPNQSFESFVSSGDADFSISIQGIGRFRVNAYRQRNSLAAVIRTVLFTLPHPQEIGIPDQVINISRYVNGLALVTGMAGSGKSTTLACIIDAINHSRNAHIITLEDPVEFIHRHDKCIVSQRELHSDTASYPVALRAALRQSPDIILLGEMRDFETISIAMTAAETGQLLLSSLHTIGAAKTIDRIIDVFPPEQQHQVRLQLSMVLQAVVSQQLLPGANGGLVPAFEIMFLTPAIRNMIRENKVKQIDSEIYAGRAQGMISMNSYIQNLLKEGKITKQTADDYMQD